MSTKKITHIGTSAKSERVCVSFVDIGHFVAFRAYGCTAPSSNRQREGKRGQRRSDHLPHTCHKSGIIKNLGEQHADEEYVNNCCVLAEFFVFIGIARGDSVFLFTV